MMLSLCFILSTLTLPLIRLCNFSHAAELADYEKMNEDDEIKWNEMIANAKSLGATEEEIRQIYGEYERTPNIYDRQAEWVGVCFENQFLLYMVCACGSLHCASPG